jgi:nuclear GTP-binding protein
LNRLKDGNPQRNAQGKITKAASYQSTDAPIARIEPNRKWFSNSRVISQETLSAFRDAIAQQSSDPNSYLLKSNKLPMSLIRDNEPETKNGVKLHRAKMVVETASFKDTFGYEPLHLCIATTADNNQTKGSEEASKSWSQQL